MESRSEATMDGNTELLNYIYQGSLMGTETIRHLLNIVSEEEFAKVLKSQYKEYEEINKEAMNLLHKEGKEEKDIGKTQEVMSSIMIELKTWKDKSSCHIAEMMMQGSLMGIIEAIKKKNRYKGEDQDIINLMDRLLKFEENNMNELKKFLKEE